VKALVPKVKGGYATASIAKQIKPIRLFVLDKPIILRGKVGLYLAIA
jgi:hypothetical protein